jgi:TonB family protein
MRFLFVAALLLASASPAAAQIPQRNNVKAPVLKNRPEIMAERQRLATRVLKRGDSLLIKVFAYVDEKGVTHGPEVKTPSGNPMADTAAMVLVSKMAWRPAQNAKRGVMLTIPVVFVRK